MEDMDIDLVVDVPDTPDRLAVRHSNGGKFVRKESNSSVSGHFRNSDFLDEESLNRGRGRGRVETENGRNRRLHVHPRKTPINLEEIERRNSDFMDEESLNRIRGRGRVETENGHNRRLRSHPRKAPSNLEENERRNNPIILSPLEKPYASRNSLLFRKTAIDKNSKDETRHSIGAHHLDKGKAMHDADCLAKEIREGQIANNGGSAIHCAPNCSMTSSNSYKGKEKIDENTCKRAGSTTYNERGIDLSISSQHKMEKEMSTSHHSVISPRVTGQKRLVRNGCISPHNIATRAQQLAERNQNSIKAEDVEQNQTSNVVSSGPCLIDINEIIAEENNFDRVKGKGVLTHPCTSEEHDTKSIHLSSSNPGSNNEEANGTRDGSQDMVGYFEGSGGWRSTHNRSRKIDYPFSDDAGSPSGMNDEVGCFVNQRHGNRVVKRDNGSERNYRDACDYQEDQDAASRLVSEFDRFSEPRVTTNTIVKRQKNGLASRNHGEFSGDNSEVVVLGSSGGSSSSSTSRIQHRQRHGILGPIFEIDELSPEMRRSDSRGISCINDDESDARARQLEADEMLARELQEQLYHEAPIFGGGEIDENIAWSLQQEDALRAASSRNRHVSHPRGLSRTHSYRHPLTRSLQNPSNRRPTQARVPARMPQLRSRIFSRSPAASSRPRNFQFPLDMDLDRRLDILEALEAAVADFSDVGTASHVLQVQRDFNENDYEMLLALDENNHRHGASVNQINSLPQSTVQTENFDEACAICLETPTIGETIRHLPCLHKFHKDCIDQWLSRKTSCPVCKSSIT